MTDDIRVGCCVPKEKTIMLKLISSTLLGLLIWTAAPAIAEEPSRNVTLYKSPQCGCCEGHAGYLRQNGFTVTVKPTYDLAQLSRMAGIPENFEGCHLSMIDGYVVSGHVPVASVERLLSEQPKIVGITLPGMRDRCIKIGSAGKTFSLTGWKVGYMTACPALLQRVAKAHQFLTFTTAPNLQRAVAFGLTKDDGYFSGLGAGMQTKRDRLRDGLDSIGFAAAPCQGTYFLNADIRSLGFEGSDVEFCQEITLNAGVTTLPVSAFYASDGARTNFVRFCFSKQDAILDGAVEKLGAWVRGR